MGSSRPLYPPEYYNDDLSLKLPWFLRLTLVYGLRHAMFVLLAFLPTTRGTLDYLREGVEPAFLIVNLLVAAVLVAAFRRRREAGSAVRSLWSAGRRLLITALALDILLSLVYGWPALTGSGSERGLLVLIQVLVATAMFFYLLRSKRVRDVFDSFPERE